MNRGNLAGIGALAGLALLAASCTGDADGSAAIGDRQALNDVPWRDGVAGESGWRPGGDPSAGDSNALDEAGDEGVPLKGAKRHDQDVHSDESALESASDSDSDSDDSLSDDSPWDGDEDSVSDDDIADAIDADDAADEG